MQATASLGPAQARKLDKSLSAGKPHGAVQLKNRSKISQHDRLLTLRALDFWTPLSLLCGVSPKGLNDLAGRGVVFSSVECVDPHMNTNVTTVDAETVL